jgi:hypothetical protein
MTLTLSQLRQKFPALDLSGSETGKWIVVYCAWSNGVQGRGERFDSYFTAHAECVRSCGCICRGTQFHQLLEISEAPAMVAPRRGRALGWGE